MPDLTLTSIPLKEAALLLSKSSGKNVTEQMLEEDIKSGAPINFIVMGYETRGDRLNLDFQVTNLRLARFSRRSDFTQLTVSVTSDQNLIILLM